MQIGIFVYSNTGHTLSVARRLDERLSADGHAVTLEELEVAGALDRSAATAPLERYPSVEPYDALVFASPVNGGRMSAPMKSYLDQIPSLERKKVICLVTHFLFTGWGAEQTMEQMTDACEAKGATVLGSGHVRWSSLRRRKRISTVVGEIAALVGA